MILIFFVWYLITGITFLLIRELTGEVNNSISYENLFKIFLINLLITTCYTIFTVTTKFTILTIEDLEALKFEVIQRRYVVEYKTALDRSRSLALLSRRVHGPLQSLIVQNLANPLSSINPFSLSTITNLLIESDKEDFLLEKFEKAVADLLSPWQGLIDTELVVNIALSQRLRYVPSISIEDIFSVIEDAVLNAYRHGKCTFVKVDLSIESSGWVGLIISNNGTPFFDDASGLGFSNFYRVLGEQWTLSNEGPYVVLRGRSFL
jgi:hypothetical protein